jgi:hypothetical protein
MSHFDYTALLIGAAAANAVSQVMLKIGMMRVADIGAMSAMFRQPSADTSYAAYFCCQANRRFDPLGELKI